MEEARAVMRRLERIEALEREGGRPGAILAELQQLVHEAEAWARLEGDERASSAAEALAGAAGPSAPSAGSRTDRHFGVIRT